LNLDAIGQIEKEMIKAQGLADYLKNDLAMPELARYYKGKIAAYAATIKVLEGEWEN